MLHHHSYSNTTNAKLAEMGNGEVGYIKKFRSEDVARYIPGAPELDAGFDLWALFSANGTPIMLSDNRSRTVLKAAEKDINTVSLH